MKKPWPSIESREGSQIGLAFSVILQCGIPFMHGWTFWIFHLLLLYIMCVMAYNLGGWRADNTDTKEKHDHQKP